MALPEPSGAPKPIGLSALVLHSGLFVVTLISVTIGYVLFTVPLHGVETLTEALLKIVTTPEIFRQGLPFSAALLSILLAHEMGHYLTARRLGVDQSLPFFIPAPGTFFGTFGAIIVMRQMPKTRSSLLRVAVMGPYAGLILAIPMTAWGLANSTPIPPDVFNQPGPHITFGSSLLVTGLEHLFSPHGADVMIEPHPVGLAGWVGLLVTALNLIPAGQLDGGHTIYALASQHHQRVSRGVALALVVSGIVWFDQGGMMWLLWAALLGAFGLKHPPVAQPSLPLTALEKRAGWMALVIFVLTFTPQPIRLENTEPRPAPPAELEEILTPEEFEL